MQSDPSEAHSDRAPNAEETEPEDDDLFMVKYQFHQYKQKYIKTDKKNGHPDLIL